jgi:hypothetical protein
MNKNDVKITKNAAYKKTPLLFNIMSTQELFSFSESCNKTRSDMEVNNCCIAKQSAAK